MKIPQNTTATLDKACFCLCVIFNFVNCFLYIWTRTWIPVMKKWLSCLCSYLCMTLALPCYPRNGVLAGYLSKDRGVENLMVHGQDCTVIAATLLIGVLWLSCQWTSLWMSLSCGGGATHFSCGMNLTSYCFCVVVTVCCCHFRQGIYKNNTFVICKLVIFPVDGARLHFFFLEDVWCHSIDYYIHFDSQWWTQDSSFTIISDGKSNLKYCIVSKHHWILCSMPLFVNLSASVAPVITNMGMAKLVSSYHYPEFTNKTGWSIIYLWLCDHHCTYVHEPDGVLSSITIVHEQPLQFCMKFCSLCLTFINPSCPLPNSTCIHSSFTMHF